jgi:predicted MFS family arabinose efflux permease
MNAAEKTSPASTVHWESANFRHLVLDIVWFGLALPATARFLAIYAIRLDATALQLGWLTGLPSIVALTTSMFARRWRARFPDTVSAEFLPSLGFRFVFLLPAMTPFFPREWQVTWLILSVALPAIPQGMASVLFLVLLREGIRDHRLTSLVSRRSLFFNVAVALSTVAMGFWLKLVTFPINYQIVFVVAFMLGLMSWTHVMKVHVIAPQPLPQLSARVRPWESRDFRRMMSVTVVAYIGFFSITAIIPLQLVNVLGADEVFMSMYALAELASAAFVSAWANRIVARIGNRPAIALGLGGTGLAAGLLVLAPSLVFTLPAAALSGGTWTLAAISLFGYFSENTPPEGLTQFSTTYNQVVMLSVFLGPMIGSVLVSGGLDLAAMLVIGIVMRLAAGGVVAGDELRRLGAVLPRRRLTLARR